MIPLLRLDQRLCHLAVEQHCSAVGSSPCQNQQRLPWEPLQASTVQQADQGPGPVMRLVCVWFCFRGTALTCMRGQLCNPRTLQMRRQF